MGKRMKVLSVFGTRPEAIKMVPLVKELEKRDTEFQSIVAVTAQHREMLDQVLDIFDVKPDYDLDIMKEKQTLASIMSNALIGLEKVIIEAKPDIVLVHGDTSTTFAATLAAFYQQVPVGHVEAGLRTWNKYSPFPEEVNRQLTGVIADLHFAPTETAKAHLLAEDKRAESIIVTGNTAIDALKTTVNEKYSHPLLDEIAGKRIVLVTAHRRENLGKNLTQMLQAIKGLVETYEDIYVVYPVHLNPAVREMADRILADVDRVSLIDPLQVTDFHNFLAKSYLILTDSGGIQEEAPSLGKPVLVLRDTTERPEGIGAGTLKLAGTDEETIFAMASKLLSDQAAYDEMAQAKNPYGDGQASARIADALLRYYQA